jgi:hypothetical protein
VARRFHTAAGADVVTMEDFSPPHHTLSSAAIDAAGNVTCTFEDDA